MLKPTIENIEAKKLIGMALNMSVEENKTGDLFRSFMPRRREIAHLHTPYTFDLRVYPEGYFLHFNPAKTFTKWALAEVKIVEHIPAGMELFELSAGQYAVFHYKGISGDPSVFQYIFSEWLPNSGCKLDNRPHFEVLGPKTKLNDPKSEEEIWVPVKTKR